MSIVVVSSLIAIVRLKDTVMTSSSSAYGCMSMAWAFEALKINNSYLTVDEGEAIVQEPVKT